jgi:flagellin
MTSIKNNLAANNTIFYINQNTKKQSGLLKQLSSGSRVVDSSTDPAGVAIGAKLNSDAKVLKQAATNATNIQSALNIADGALSQIADIITQLKSLASGALSGTQDEQSLTNIQTEYTLLVDEIKKISVSTTFNGKSLIDGSYSNVSVLIGTTSADTITINLSSVNLGSTFTSTLGAVSTTALATSALVGLTSAINTLAGNRARVGSYNAQFQYSEAVASVAETNTTAAASTITDADAAQVQTEYNNASTLSQAGIAALIKAQSIPADLLRLLQA